MKLLKILVTAILLMAVAKVVKAEGGVRVYEVVDSTFMVTTVTVSTSVVTQLDSIAMSNRTVIEIQNTDTTASLWCSNDSTITSGNGHKILAGTSWILSMSNRGTLNPYSAASHALTVYCISDGAASTKAAVAQLR